MEHSPALMISDKNVSDENKDKISKRMQKKLRLKQEWLEKRAEKRKLERSKKKEKLHRAKEEGKDIYLRKKLKRNTMACSNCHIKVVIDCSFNDQMSEKDVNSTVNQIQHAYGANRRAKEPMQLYITSLGGTMLTRFEQLADYKNWDLHFHTESYLALFDKSLVVYLTSDSPNILDKLDNDKIYIIGGLTDHNKHKGLCFQIAKEHGLNHAQLPISQYMSLKTRQVLTVNQVFEILVQYYETSNWETAFFNVIPKRKGAQCRTSHDTRSDIGGTPDVMGCSESATDKLDAEHTSEVTSEVINEVTSDPGTGCQPVSVTGDSNVRLSSDNEHKQEEDCVPTPSSAVSLPVLCHDTTQLENVCSQREQEGVQHDRKPTGVNDTVAECLSANR